MWAFFEDYWWGSDVPVSEPPVYPVYEPTVVDVEIPIGDNLLGNYDFETDDFGVIGNWTSTDIELNRWYIVDDPDGGREVTWISEGGIYGSGGLEIKDEACCGAFSSVEAVQIVPAVEGLTYTVGAHITVAQGDSGTLYLDFLDDKMNRIDVVTVGGGTSIWSSIDVFEVAPIGTKYIRVILYSGNESMGTNYWDNVTLIVN